MRIAGEVADVRFGHHAGAFVVVNTGSINRSLTRRRYGGIAIDLGGEVAGDRQFDIANAFDRKAVCVVVIFDVSAIRQPATNNVWFARWGWVGIAKNAGKYDTGGGVATG